MSPGRGTTGERTPVDARPSLVQLADDDDTRRFVDRDELLDLAARVIHLGRLLEAAAARPELLDATLRQSLLVATNKVAWRVRQVTA